MCAMWILVPLFQILDTTSADKVQISIEGDTEAKLSDGTSLYSLFSKNTDLILKEN